MNPECKVREMKCPWLCLLSTAFSIPGIQQFDLLPLQNVSDIPMATAQPSKHNRGQHMQHIVDCDHARVPLILITECSGHWDFCSTKIKAEEELNGALLCETPKAGAPEAVHRIHL